MTSYIISTTPAPLVTPTTVLLQFLGNIYNSLTHKNV